MQNKIEPSLHKYSKEELQTYLEKLAVEITEIMSNEFSVKLIFHDIEHVHSNISALKSLATEEALSDEQRIVLEMCVWLFYIGFLDIGKMEISGKDGSELLYHCHRCSLIHAERIMIELDFPEDLRNKVLYLHQESNFDNENELTHEAQILQDVVSSDWGQKNARQRIQKLYNQFLLLNAISVGRGGWYEKAIEYLERHQYYTATAQKLWSSGKQELIDTLKSEIEAYEEKKSHAIKKDLDINNKELKKLTKKLSKVKGRDARAIQTLFRTTSKNSYTLNEMVDRKANIMISINAIIISLIVGRFIGARLDGICIHYLPIFVLLLTSLASIISAVSAIRPAAAHGSFSMEEIQAKKGNLLYFGNFYNMKYEDYEYGMLEMLSDADHLYTTMIRDLYFMGKMLGKKYKMIRFSLLVFGVGILASIILFVSFSFMPDFHLFEPHISE